MDVFIIYARENTGLVQEMIPELHASGDIVSVTQFTDSEQYPWHAIPVLERLKDTIAASDIIIFILSEESIVKSYCNVALAYARSYNKRIIPVLLSQSWSPANDFSLLEIAIERIPVEEKVGAVAEVPYYYTPRSLKTLAHENFEWIRTITQYVQHVGAEPSITARRIIEVMHVDAKYVHLHTVLLEHALDWYESGKDRGFLLRGSALRAAQHWLDESAYYRPWPSRLHQEYIRASLKRRQAFLTSVVTAGLGVISALAVGVLSARNIITQNALSKEGTAQAIATHVAATVMYSELPVRTSIPSTTTSTFTPTPTSVARLIKSIEIIDLAGEIIGEGSVRLYAPESVQFGDNFEVRLEIEALNLPEHILNPEHTPTPMLGTPQATPSPAPLTTSQFIIVREWMGAGLRGVDHNNFVVDPIPPSGLRKMENNAVNWWKWVLSADSENAIGRNLLEAYVYLPNQLSNGVEWYEETNIIPFYIEVVAPPTATPTITPSPTSTNTPTPTSMPTPTNTPTPTPTYTPTPRFIERLSSSDDTSVDIWLARFLAIGGFIAMIWGTYSFIKGRLDERKEKQAADKEQS